MNENHRGGGETHGAWGENHLTIYSGLFPTPAFDPTGPCSSASSQLFYSRVQGKVLSPLRIPPSREVPSYLDDSRSESAILQVHSHTFPLQHTLTCPVLHSRFSL